MRRVRFALGICFFTSAGAAFAACSSNPTTPISSGGAGGEAGSGGGGSANGGSGGDIFIDGGPGCQTGDPCGDGGVCAGGSCCTVTLACGNVCCNDGQVCSFQQCVTPGATCVDPTDCPAGSYCDYSLGEMSGAGGNGSCQGGAMPQTGKCLPKPPVCGPNQMPGNPIECLPACEYKPPTTDFNVVVKYSWGGQVAPPYSSDVMMTPIVAQLDDDNCDGKINQNDIPEIIFSTFTGGGYFKQGTLHAISVVGGQIVEKWTLPNVTQPGAGLAAADLDGDGKPEIVGCANPGPSGASCCDSIAQNTGVVAFRADGSPFWSQLDTTKVHCGYESPAIGDVDQDGSPEVLIGFTLLDGKTGAIKKELDPATSWGLHISGLSDLDGDGKLDITDGQRAYRATGDVLWDLRTGANAIPKGYHAIGDFDKNGKPEVVVISSSNHTMSVVQYDPAEPGGAKVIRRGIDINNGISTATFCNAASEYGGGPPTIADFNGDGIPDVGAAGAVGYVVMDGAKIVDPNVPDNGLILWFKETHDCSSAVTGSSVFDFNGDGKAEVIYSDEYHLWMYDGATGTNLIPSTCNTTGTLWEYPLVADVDNDGQADIVVASNAYGITCPDDGTKQSGVRILGSASGSWVRTRRIWNQHTYHVSNVGEDNTIPMMEQANWTVPGLNNYRQNRQPGAEFSAPDAVVSVSPKCFEDFGLIARVQNLGSASLPAGVKVGFYYGAAPGTKLGEVFTQKTLYPAEAENVTLLLPAAPIDVSSGKEKVFVVVDDGMPPHTWQECRTDNNVSASVPATCDTPK
jgi:hypothetical protein